MLLMKFGKYLKNHDEDGVLQFILTPSKYRMSVKKSAFLLVQKYWYLLKIDVETSKYHWNNSETLYRFGLENLKDGSLSQNKLLKPNGFNKADKSKINLLNHYVRSFGTAQLVANRAKIYEAIPTF